MDQITDGLGGGKSKIVDNRGEGRDGVEVVERINFCRYLGKIKIGNDSCVFEIKII